MCSQAANEKLLYAFAKKVSGVVVPVHQALEMMSYFRSRTVLQRTAFRGFLEIGPDMKIGVSVRACMRLCMCMCACACVCLWVCARVFTCLCVSLHVILHVHAFAHVTMFMRMFLLVFVYAARV